MSESHKRVSLLVKTWKKIQATAKYKDWELSVVGDGPDLQATKDMADSLPRIRFYGLKEPKPYFLESSIFLMTSAREGFPMVLGEAQALGCVPVVFDSFASLHDIVKDGENGMIAPDGDMEAFVEKVCCLMDDADLRKNMMQKGQETVQRFAAESVARKWEALFLEVVK
jgi:glycosyltransferase involved in cell wall biosynthesis